MSVKIGRGGEASDSPPRKKWMSCRESTAEGNGGAEQAGSDGRGGKGIEMISQWTLKEHDYTLMVWESHF
jgi:hypothetical protein